MLNLILGEDWISNQNAIMDMIAQDVKREKEGRILIVPELISHSAERLLCETAGDTASRFAQVLSFTRLARRVTEEVGHAPQTCLDDGGRIVAMAAAVQSVGSRLKAYASVGTKPEFLVSLVDAVDEFKRCCIGAADLMHASLQTTGSLAQKLEELSLILESYDGICQRGKKDPRDQMQWLLDELKECSYAEDHVFYINGFPDFTRQNMAIIEHLIRHSPVVTVAMCCDNINSASFAFEKAGKTAAELVSIAKRHNIAVDILHVNSTDRETFEVTKQLLQGPLDIKSSCLHLFQCESVYQECIQVADRINELVRNGTRYRQIGVACADMPTYRYMLHNVFNRSNIPAYLSGTESILDKPVINTVLSAIDTAMGGFEQKDVICYLKTSFSPIDDEIADQVENYAIKWGIERSDWLKEWTNHPVELRGKWTDRAKQMLATVNGARDSLMSPLADLRTGLLGAKNIAQQVEAVYGFFERISLAEKLKQMADNCGADEQRNAQILDQLWEILVNALEQLHDVVGDCAWEPDLFTRLFKLLLSQYSVGTIPATLDSVTVGPVSAMRCSQVEHLFVLGALEGSLPSYGSTKGVLTDNERTELRSLGLPLTGGALDGLQIEFSEIYELFCGANKSITVSCPAGQPSFIYERLEKIAEAKLDAINEWNVCLSNKTEAAAYLARAKRKDLAKQFDLTSAYDKIVKAQEHDLGFVSQDSIEALYGKKLRLSASKVDLQARCRLSYFLRYGLNLEERKTITIDPSEFGSFVHDVLEHTVTDVMDAGGFSSVSCEETLEIAKKHSQEYVKENFSGFDAERLTYLFNRNMQELDQVVVELWDELRQSRFEPTYMELGFEVNEAMDPIEVQNAKMAACLRGYVDRVDLWKTDDNTYFRVIDYKTGKKAFDYCDVINGIGLQMLLYLYALEENGQHLIGDNGVPAGVQYFPARVPFLSLKGSPDEKTVTASRKAEIKRKGIILADEAVIQAMEPLDNPYRLSYSRNKEGDLTGDVVSLNELDLLKDFVFELLREFVDEIASGDVSPNPYYRDQFDNACKYCPYGKVCYKNDVENVRVYRAISADEFWESIRKERDYHG